MTFADLSPLANHLWQSTLCVAMAWLLTLALRKNRAAVRFWIWFAASAKFLLPFSLFVSAGRHLTWRAAPAIAPSQFSFAMETLSQPFAVPAATPLAPVVAPALNPVPAILVGVWLCGIAVGLVFWVRWWRQTRRLLRASTQLNLGLPIRVMSTAARFEPGVVGIFRPVLLLPAGIAEHLTPAQFEAIIAHELRHAERRDNLTAAIHMLVETIFWFHPLVWWIKWRLIEERERACDEGVLGTGSEPRVYAESILKVCEFYLAAPAPCVAGVTGGELKKRIEGIMENRFGLRLGLGKKILLAAGAVVVVAIPVALQGQAQRRTFDVASVKLSDATVFSGDPERTPGRFSWKTQLAYLVRYGFNTEWTRTSGGSGWGNIYEVDATMDPKAKEDDIRLMVRSLLEDRFKMTWHYETKQSDGWALTVAKNGPKFNAYKDDDPAPPMPNWNKDLAPAGDDGRIWGILHEPYVVSLTGRRITMSQFCSDLELDRKKPVWDETGLKGKYYIAFRYSVENAPLDVEVSAPLLDAALQENLGLKIEKRSGTVQVLVIDHIEKVPTGN